MAEAGYRCAIPNCRALTTLGLCLIDEQGRQEAGNLICLCARCSDRYSRDGVPSLRTMEVYRSRLRELSRALARESIDLLLYLAKIEWLAVSGDKVAEVAPILNAGYMYADYKSAPTYRLRLTQKGRDFVEAWQQGEG